MPSVSSLIDFVRTDLTKLIRYAAVSLVTVPIGLLLFFLLLQTDLNPVVANLVATGVSSIPNYVLNRYWVWNKRGANSIRREIAPFWLMVALGVVLSTIFVAIASSFTEIELVLLAAQFVAFGLVWLLKFFVLETYLFGPRSEPSQVAS